MFKPYPRQEEAIEKIQKFILSKTTKKGIFVYPTSFGKSIVIANVAALFPDCYFINTAPKKELIQQNYDKYTSYGYEASICSASLKSNEVGKVTFGTIGTLKKHVDFFKDKRVILLSDECHDSSKRGSQLDMFVRQLKECKVIGVTATPLRLSSTMQGTFLKMMNKDRDCMFTSIEDVVQISEVVEQGYWSKLLYQVEAIDESYLKLNTTGTDFTVESLSMSYKKNDITSKIVDNVNNLIAEGRGSILIFVPLIENAIAVSKALPSCAAVYSGMETSGLDRDQIISDFKNLKIKVVVQCSILGTGFDHPRLDGIIFAKPTNSITIWYQGIGRGVRLHKDKANCRVVDLSGNFNRFGKVEDITFEDTPYTKGWAGFSKDKLITNYPLGSGRAPSRESLQVSYNREMQKEAKVSPTINFGKYKGKTVDEVFKENKSYLAWLAGNKDFNWFGTTGAFLKKTIEEKLQLI